MNVIRIRGSDNGIPFKKGSEQVDRHNLIGIETHFPGDALANLRSNGAVGEPAGIADEWSEHGK